MSVFTNPASASREQASQYVAATLELLGDQDPMDVMAKSAGRLSALIKGLDQGQVETPEADGKWSIRHVLQHLADSELVAGFRMRMALAHDRPPIGGYDQDLFADGLNYDAVRAETALADFQNVRELNLRLLRRVARSDLDRVGVHAERGEESVAHMMKLYAGHDLIHIRQVERIRDRLAG